MPGTNLLGVAQAEKEPGTYPALAFHCQRTALQFEQVLADGRAQTGATVLALSVTGTLLEGLEYLPLSFYGCANASIPY